MSTPKIARIRDTEGKPHVHAGLHRLTVVLELKARGARRGHEVAAGRAVLELLFREHLGIGKRLLGLYDASENVLYKRL